METYLQLFVNFKQNNWAKLLPIVQFAYNNTKNASTDHTPFKLKCSFHFQTSYKEDVNPRSQSKSANKLITELKELMAVCKKNFNMHKSFKNNIITSMQNLKAVP